MSNKLHAFDITKEASANSNRSFRFHSPSFLLYNIIALLVVALIFRVIVTSMASTSDQTVQVWVTYANKTKLLSQEGPITWTSLSSSSSEENDLPTIQIDATKRYQTIEGVGAALTDSSAWLISKKMPKSKREKLLKNLFTREGNGIGINYLRIPLGASDFALSNYSYDDLPKGKRDSQLERFSIKHDADYIIPLLKAIQNLNPALRRMASPWSAPAWMKTSQSLKGGSLLPECYQTYANYTIKSLQAYSDVGLPFDTITPQNEPMHESDNYPTMRMEAEDQKKYVRDHLGPSLAAADGIGTRILIWDHNWDFIEYPLSILEDEAARDYVVGVAFHGYGGKVEKQTEVNEKYPDKGIWFTECSGGRWSTDFGNNMEWNLRHLIIGNFRNWGKSLLLWNLALDHNGRYHTGSVKSEEALLIGNVHNML